jgi:hypothetical protein
MINTTVSGHAVTLGLNMWTGPVARFDNSTSCEAVYGVILQPYWMIAVSTLVTIIPSIVCHLIQNGWEARSLRWIDTIHPVVFWSNASYQATLLSLMFFQLSTLPANTPPWHRYQALFVRWFNSGVMSSLIMPMCFVLRSGATKLAAGAGGGSAVRAVAVMGMVTGLLLLPNVVTHWLPGVMCFFWVAALMALAGRLWWPMSKEDTMMHCPSGWPVGAQALALVAARFFVIAVPSLVLASLTNWMVLLYDTDGYGSSIAKEFALRNTQCYLHAINQDFARGVSVDSIHFLAFIGNF